MFITHLKNINNKKNNNIEGIITVLNNLTKNIILKKKRNLEYLKFFSVFLKQTVKKIDNIFIKDVTVSFLANLQKQLFLNKIHNFLLKVNFLKSNVITNVTDTKGKIIVRNSSGLMHFKSKQKIKALAINAVFRKIKFKIRNKLKYNFSAHLTGKQKKRFLIKKLKNFLKLKSITNFNLSPFNGCRQKKRKRKKNKKKVFLV